MNGMDSNMNGMNNNANTSDTGGGRGRGRRRGRHIRRGFPAWVKVLSVTAAGAMLVSGLSVMAAAVGNNKGTTTAAHAASRNITLPTQSAIQWVFPYAGTEGLNGNLPLDNNKLYASRNFQISQFTNYDANGNLTSNATTNLVTNTVGSGSGQGGTSATTLAIDSGLSGTKPTFYTWAWDSSSNATTSDIGQTVPGAAASRTTVYAYPANGTSGTTLPDNIYFVPNPDYTGQGTPFMNYWSGGEVDQNTGYIYFSGGEHSYIRGTSNVFEMMIFDPKTGNYNASGVIQPATSADAFSTNGYVASDMVIDAAGNAYIVIMGDPGKIPGTNTTLSGGTDWLVKVVPGTPGNWTYSRVSPLYTGTTAGSSVDTNSWGMGFLNGQLYMNNAGSTIYRINPLTGLSTSMGSMSFTAQDFGSPQSAAALTGTVYNDANGNGQLDSGEAGVANETVQLYNASGQVVGQQTTNASGQYSFLVPGGSGTSTYYVRVVQPQVNGANAVQTFANVDSQNGFNNGQLMSMGSPTSQSAPQAPYVDPPAPAMPTGTSTTGGTANLSQVPAYTQINVTSSNDVTTANFGVSSQGSYGDAASTFKAKIAEGGPQHVEGPTGPNVWLGAKDGSYSDGSNTAGAYAATNDGVMLSVPGGSVSPQGQILAAGNKYTFNYTLNGNNSGGANVYAWLPSTNGGTTFATPGVTGSNGTFQVTLPSTAVTSGSSASEYLRVNASTNSSITANTPDNSTGAYAPTVGSTASGTQTWTSDGETEDYQVGVANAVVHLQVTADSAGQYSYALQNIVNSGLSSTQDQFAFNQKGTITSNVGHAVSSVGQNVVVTPNGVPTGELLQSATLVNTLNGQTIATLAPSGNPPTQVVTIPGANLAQGADVTLQLVYGKAPAAAQSSWSMSPTSIAADGTTAATVTVNVNSADNSPLTGQTVSIQAPAAVTVGAVKDNGDGTYTATLTSTTAGTYQIGASVSINGQVTAITNPSATQQLTVTPTSASPTTSTYSVSSTSVVANGTATVPVTVTTKDANNNPTSGSVTLTVDAPAQFGNGTQTIIVTTGDGTGTTTLGSYVANITSTKAGNYAVTATVGGTALPVPAANTASFVAGPPSLTSSTWAVTGSPAPADNSTYATGTVTITDQNNNPITGVTVTVDLPANVTAVDPSSGQTLVANAANQVTVVTGTDGTARVRYTSAKTGSYTVGAYLLAPNTVTGAIGGAAPANNLVFSSQAPVAGSSSFSVSSTAVTANGTATVPVTVTTKDGNNNVTAGSVVLTVQAPAVFSDSGTQTTTVTTDATTGIGTANLTSLKAGNYTVSATLNGAALPTPTANTAIFVAGPGTIGNSTWVVTPSSGSKPADGSSSFVGTVTVNDANSNPVNGAVVKVDVPPITGIVAKDNQGTQLSVNGGQVSVTTDPSGQATVTFTSTGSGSGQTNAYLTGVPTGTATGAILTSNIPTITFASGTPVASKSSWTVNPTTSQAVGTGGFTVTVNLKDANGNPSAGYKDSISIVAGSTTVGTTVDNGDGSYTIPISTTLAGTYTVTASVSGTQITSPNPTATIVFTAGTPDLTKSFLSVTTKQAYANGTDTQTAQATIVDAYNNAVPNVPVTFTAAVGSVLGKTVVLNPSTQPVPSDPQGHAIVNVTTTTADSYPITATVSGTKIGGTDNPQPVVFMAGTPSAGTLAIDNANGVTADGNASHAVTVTVTDSTGNLLLGVPVSFKVDSGATLSSSQIQTNAQGQAIVQVTSKVAGSYTVTPTVAGVTLTPNPTVTAVFVAGAASATTSSLAVDSGSPKADGQATHTLTATVLDVNNNPVNNVPVTFAVQQGSAVLKATSATTDASGIATVQVTDTVAEIAQVTATINVGGTQTGIKNSPIAVPFAAGDPSASQSTLIASSPSAAVSAPGTGGITLTATVKDANGNLLANVPVKFGVPQTGSSAQLSVTGALTGSDGVARATVTDQVAEALNATATIVVSGTDTNITGSPTSLTFTAGAPDPNVSVLSIDNNTAVAGNNSTHTVTATIKDSFGNTVKNVGVKFSIASGTGGSLSSPGDISGTNGTVTTQVKSSDVGTIGVAATISVNGVDTPILGSPVPAVFNAGAPDSTKSTLKVDNTTGVVADGVQSHTVTATVMDANSNLLSGVNVVFTAPTGTLVNGQATATVATGVNGQAQVTVTSTTAGQIPISATVNGSAINPASVNAYFIPGQPDMSDGHSTVVISGGPKTADGQDAYTVTATLMDKNGNLIVGTPVAFSASPGSSVGSATVQTNSSGVATTTATSTVAGNQLVNATVGGVNLNGSPLTAQFVAGPVDLTASNVKIDSSTSVSADGNSTHTITAVVQDKFNNPISGQVVTFTPQTGLTLSNTTMTTGGNGTVSVTATTTKNGAYTVGASVSAGALNGSPVTANYASGTPDPAGPYTTWTVTPSGTVPADGNSSYTGTVTVGDTQGNPTTGTNVTIDVPNGVKATVNGTQLAVTGGQATLVTDGTGKAVVTYTSTTEGKYSVGAYINTPAQQIGNKQNLQFISTSPVAGNSSWTVTPTSSQTADGVQAFTATVTLKDASGNTVKNQAANVSITSAASGPQFTLPKDNGDGTYTVTITSKNAGTFTLTASVSSAQIGNTQPVTFVAGPFSPTASHLDVTQGQALANGVAVQTATATITDQYGNPIVGQQVSFSVAAGLSKGDSAKLSQTTQTTNASGVASVTVTATTADSYPVSATVQNTQISNSPSNATFIAGAPATGTVTVVDAGTNVVADGSSTHTVQATVQDANGNNLSGVVVNFTAATGATVTASATTNTNGIATAYVTSLKAGSYVITPSVTVPDGTVTFTPSTVTASFVAGSPDLGPNGKSSVTIDANSPLANGTDTHTVTATVLDANSNPIQGQTVTFAVVSGVASLTTATQTTAATTVAGTTDANGVATATVTSTAVGSPTVSATVSGQALKGSPVTAPFLASAPDAVNSSLVVTTTGAIADGNATNSVTATIQDAQGHPLANVPVSFNVASGKASLSAQSTLSGANGQAVITLTSTTAGPVQIGATISVNGTQTAINHSPVSLSFVAGPASPNDSTVSVDTATATANGTDKHTITATIVDANKNPVQGQLVDFAAVAGKGVAGTLSGLSATTGPDGTAAITVTSTNVGSVFVSAAIGGTAVKNSPAEAVFSAGDPSTGPTGLSTLAVDNNTGVVADGVQSHTVTATVKDGSGNTIPGVTVAFSIPQNTGTLSALQVQTGPNGQAQVTITSKVATNIPVSATVNGNGLNPSSVVANFIPGSMDPSQSTLSISTGAKKANGTDAYTVTALLKDSNGNAIANTTVNFTGSTGATLSAPTAPTNGSGVASITVTSTVAGNHSIAASVLGVAPGNSPVTAHFDAGDPDMTQSTVVIDTPNSVAADGKATHTVTATVVDAYKNPIAGATVSFSTTGGALSADSGTTDANGQIPVTITATKSGAYQVSATVGGSGLSGSPVTANFTSGNPDPNAPTTTWVVAPTGTVPADGSSAYTGTVTVTDSNGNPVNAATVTVDVPQGVVAKQGATTLGLTNNQAQIVTNASGVATVSYTSQGVGTYQVGAYVNTPPAQIGQKATLDFVTTAPVPGNSSWSVSPTTSLTADGTSAFTATVTLKDGSSHPVSGAGSSISITSSASGPQFGPVTDNGDGTYTVAVTSKIAGTYTLTAALGATQIGSTNTVTFVAGPFSPTASNLSVTDGSVLANNSDIQTATAKITDANGNPIQGETVTFGIGNGLNTGKNAATLSQTTQTTNADGVASVSVKSSVADSFPVSATVQGTQIKGSPANATFVAGSPAQGTVVIDSQTGVAADGKTAHVVQATVQDANGNPLSGVTVNFAAQTGASVNASATTNASGVATANVTSVTTGNYVVTPSVTGVTFAPATVTAVFVAGPPDVGPTGKSNVTIDSNTALANGTDTRVVTATVLDANDNPVANQPITFAVASGTANLSVQSGLTGADGTITTAVTSTAVGSPTISATLNGTPLKGSPVTASFVSSPPSATNSTFVQTTTGAIADGKATNSATVTIVDGQNHPLSNVQVAFSIVNGVGQLGAASALTDAAGQYVLTVTSTKANTVTLGASITVGGVTSPVTGNPQLSFISGDADPGTSTITADTNTVLANGTDTHTVTVTALDAQGNAVNNVPVQFSITNGIGVLSSTTPVNTSANGTAVITVTSTTVGSVDVAATIAGTAVKNSPVTLVFSQGLPDTGPTGKSTLAVDNTTGVVADGVQTHTVTATVLDGSGHPLPKVTVNFSSNGILSAQSVLTGANGQAQVTVASKASGPIPVSATVDGNALNPASVDAIFIPGSMDPTNGHSILAISSGPKTANGTDAYTVTATLADANGNVIPNTVVDFTGSTDVQLSGTKATTNGSGVATISVTSTVAGNHSVAASVLGVALGNSPVTASFEAGPVDVTQSTLAIDTLDAVVADGTSAHTITATVVDSYKNPISGKVVNFTSTGGALSSSSGTTDAKGQVVITITATKTGSYTVSGTVQGAPLTGSPVTANFTFGDPDLGPNGQSSLTTTQGAVVADGKQAHSATATILDANKNQVAGQNVVFTVTGSAEFSNGTQTITASTGVSDGAPAVVTITSTTAGTYQVTATLNNTALKGSPATVEFSNGAADPTTSTFTVSPDGPILANGTAAYTATVTALDGTKNPVPGQVITFTVPTGLTGPTQATTNDKGVATASYTSVTANTYPLTASIGSTTIATKNLVYLSAVKPDAPVVNPSNGKEASGKGTPGDTITVTDGNGNTIGTGTVGTDGSYQIPLTPAQGDGSTITVVDTSPSGVPSDGTTVTVDAIAPDAPKVNPSNGSKVTGTAEPGSNVNVTTPDSSGKPVILCTVKADATTGAFSCAPVPKPSNGTELSVTATDAAGNESDATKVTVNTVPPAPPVVDPSNGSEVDGTAQPGSDVKVTDPDGKILCETTAAADGSFSCKPDPTPKDGDKMEVTATDPAGNTSDPTTVVTDSTAPDAPIVNPSNGSKVTGTAEASSTVKVYYNGKVIASGPAGTDGSFSIPIDPKVADGVVLKVTATDAAKNESKATSVTVDGIAPVAPVVNPSNGSEVSGTAEPGSEVKVTDKNGDLLCKATADATTGAYSCVPQPTPGNGDTISVTATDPSGNESPKTDTTISTVKPASPQVNPTNGNQVTGSAQPGSVVNVTTKDGNGNVVQLCKATAVATTGAFSCVPAPKPGDGQVLSVTATDKYGNVSDPTTVTVDAVPPVAPIVNPSNGDKVTGTAEPGSTVTVTDPNNPKTPLCTASADATTGAFSCVPAPAPKNGDTISVTATDPSGNQSKPTEVTVDTVAPAAPKVDPSNGDKVTGTAEPGSTVTVTDPNNPKTPLCTATADATTGAFSCVPAPAPKNGDTISVTATDPSGNTSDASKVVIDTVPPAAPTVDPSNGTKVTGKAEPGSTVEVSVGGKVVGSVTAGTDGSYTITLDPKVGDGVELSVTATDPSGNKSDETKTTVDGIAPDAPVVNPTNGSQVTGKAEPGSTVTVTTKDSNGNPITLCKATAADDGTYSCIPNPKPGDGQQLQVTATDPAGNVSKPTQVTVTATPPNVPIVNPSNGSKVDGIAQPGSTVTVTDANGKVLCTTTADATTGAYSCEPKPAPVNDDVLSVTATDAAGNASQPGHVTIDTIAPNAPQVNPSNGSTVTGTAEPGSTVTVKDATGKVLCKATAAAGTGAFSCEPKPAPVNDQVLSVTATDASGNESDVTKVTVDTVPPVAPIVDPSNGSKVTGTAEPGSTVTVKDSDGNVLCTAKADATTGAFSCVPMPKPGDGSTVTVTATDPSGNESKPTTVTIDAIPPAPPVVKTPVNGSTTNNNTPTFSGTGEPGATVTVKNSDGKTVCAALVQQDGTWSCITTTATGQTTAGQVIHVTDAGGNVVCTVTADATGKWSCDMAFPEGVNTVQVTQTDPSGNESPATSDTFTVDTIAPAAPVISSPASGSTIKTASPSISGTAEPGSTVTVKDELGRTVCTATADADGTWSCVGRSAAGTGVPGENLKFVDSNGNLWCETTVGADGTWVCPAATFTNGDHTLTATATDAAGNVSKPSTGTFTVQQTPTVTSPKNGSTTTSQTPTFTGTAGAGDALQITNGQGQVVCSTTVTKTGTWSCVPTAQPAGKDTYTVTDTTVNASTTVTYATIVVDRIQGPDRYSTAAAAAAAAFPNGASTVIVAMGTNYPDALSAVPAASRLNAPILLTPTAGLTSSTLNELNTLHPSKVIVLGTTVSVSDAAFNQIKGAVTSKPEVIRIGGVDRYDTSRQLAQYVWGSTSAAVVATGQTFTDAESAGAAAAKLGVPLILVNGNANGLDAPTASIIRSLGIGTIHVVGNTTTLNQAVYSGLAGLGTTDRISGSDAGGTAIAVSTAFWPTSSQVFIARDDDFADALTGGATAARAGAPMLLSNTKALTAGVAQEVLRLGSTQVHIMGDPNSITNGTMSTLTNALNQ